MSYFINCSDREGSFYVEFNRGEWNDQSHWKDDSILISDTFFEDYIYDIFSSVIEDFDYFGVNRVTKQQWDKITQLAVQSGNETEAIIKEADGWVQETLQERDYFTILGL